MWESKQTISTDHTTKAIELSYLEIKRYITNTLKNRVKDGEYHQRIESIEKYQTEIL